MRRLFLKFLLAFCLAQLTAAAGVSVLFWLDHGNERHHHGLPPDAALDAAEAVLRSGGEPALRRFVGEARLHRLQVFDAAGRALAGGAPPGGPAKLGELRRERRIVLADGRGYRLVASAPAGPPRRGLPPPEALLAGVIASLIFSAALAWHFVRPIRALRAACEAVSGGDLDVRPAKPLAGRRDELAELARDFERMTGRVRELIDARRRLWHDVSHELRSPLARLQLAIDLARQRPERAEASLARIEREAGRMEGLIAEVLTLSRLEADVGVVPRERLDLADLLAELVDDARFEGEASGREVQLDAAGPLAVNADPGWLHRALDNVVRNALVYTPEGGRITVCARRDGGMARVEVADSGPGVPPEELEAIFETFRRGDAAREGYGLGLAIARRVLEAHGGGIVARNRAAGGLCVALSLPLTS